MIFFPKLKKNQPLLLYLISIRTFTTPAAPLKPNPNAARSLPKKIPLPGVKNIILVASGKGGVGKSTSAVNLALTLALQKKAVGLLDADVFGPSIPKMMNLSDKTPQSLGRKITPLLNYGVKCMSMGFLVDPQKPVVWRGLMVMKAIQQLLFDVAWGPLDVLIIDMPPGTGDTQLSVCQLVPVSGVVIVSTPQDVALADAIKAIHMFSAVQIPILGIVQNMSGFICPNCSHESHIFGQDGVQKVCQQLNIDHLGDIPLDIDIMNHSDRGSPIVVSQPHSAAVSLYAQIVAKILAKLKAAASLHSA